MSIVKINLKADRQFDVLTSAWEGGSTYWCAIADKSLPIVRRFRKKNDKDEPPSFVEMVWKAVLAGETITLIDTEQNAKEYSFNLRTIKKGEQLMADKALHHLVDILSENDDATTADVWFQYCVLGDLIYG